MIVPITDEPAWLGFLEDLPAWSPSAAPIVLVVPHPDDEVLGVGGLVAAQRSEGRAVSVVAVTDGEQAYPESTDAARLGVLRCEEQTAALHHLGVEPEGIVRLRFPDSDVASHVPQLIEQLSLLVSKDTHIVAPWRGDFHPDHEACGIAAEEVARRTGAMLTSYFFWTWHRGTPELLRNLGLRSFPLCERWLQVKREALLCHGTQLYREGRDPILPVSLLAPAARPFEVFLSA